MRLILLMAILLPLTCLSQIDSTYIGFYEKRLGISTYVSRDFVFVSQQTEDRDELVYIPNNPAKIGAGFSVNNSSLSFSYGYGFDFFRSKERGKTTSFDFQYHNYGRKFVFDAYVQQYEGFYSEDENGKTATVYSDMEIEQYIGHGIYVFNNKKYSYRAAFNQSEKQLKSAGSFLLGGGAYYTHIKSDSSFIYNDKSSFRRFQFGVSAGYAYTWVLGRYWLISASGTAGVNLGQRNIFDFGNKLEVYPSVFPRFSAAYSHKSWVISFSAVSNILFNVSSENNSISVSSGSVQMSFRKRFELPRKKIFKIFDIL